jgi:hypothetical protein
MAYDFNNDSSFNIGDIIFLIKQLFSGSGSSPTPTPVVSTPTLPAPNPTAPPTDVVKIVDTYIASPSYAEPKQSFIGEIRLLSAAADILKAKNWNGQPNTISISLNEINPSLLANIQADEEARKTAFTIPSNLEPYYKSEQGQKEIEVVVKQARSEYVDYLQAKGVDQGIINAFDKEILLDLDESIVLLNDYVDQDTISQIKPGPNGENDQIITISTISVWNDARLLRESKVVEHMYGGSGENYEKLVRDIAARRQAYHEMTHALQHAFNLYKGSRRNIAYFEKAYFKNWGEPDYAFNERYLPTENKHLGYERQAEGVSLVMVSDKYNFSPKQKEQYYSIQFERFSEVRQHLENYLSTIEDRNPNYNPLDFPSDFMNSLQKNGGYGQHFNTVKIVFRAVGAAAYVGYFNPLSIQEVENFWALLQ